MSQERVFGPWRQDELEPRIILDGEGDFFAIGVSAFEAERIVESLNRTEPAKPKRSAIWNASSKPSGRGQDH
ncbi:MAG TPA: hypothetical protein VIX13_03450 [Candidatus Eisenbacteria bacterium]